MKKSKITVITIIFIMVMIYVLYSIYLLVTKKNDTYVIKEGTISLEETNVGYVIREEEVLQGENIENGIYSIATEGQKIAKEDIVFRYYSDNEGETNSKIKEIDFQIQEALKAEENVTSSVDIKAIESQIEEKITNINQLNNVQEIIEYKKSIDDLISKKIKYISNSTKNKEIKKLIEQRTILEDELKEGAEYITSNFGGIVSYRVDGLEDILTPDKFEELSDEFLESLDLKTGQIVATSTEQGKVINNFKAYIAIVMDSEQSKKAKVGDKANLGLPTSKEVTGKITYIKENAETRTIVFEIDKMPEELMNHRKISIDVTWWSISGLKVPNQALTEEDGLYYVTRNKSGYTSKILVNVVKQNEKFAIIKSYTSKELLELGFSQKEINNYKKINNYDEIVLNSTKK